MILTAFVYLISEFSNTFLKSKVVPDNISQCTVN